MCGAKNRCDMAKQFKVFWIRKNGSALFNNELAPFDRYALELQRKMEKWLAGEPYQNPVLEIEIAFKLADAKLIVIIHDPDPALDD